MDAFQLDDIMAMEPFNDRSSRQRPVKRKWREIEALKERYELKRELRELDLAGEYNFDELDF